MASPKVCNKWGFCEISKFPNNRHRVVFLTHGSSTVELVSLGAIDWYQTCYVLFHFHGTRSILFMIWAEYPSLWAKFGVLYHKKLMVDFHKISSTRFAISSAFEQL